MLNALLGFSAVVVAIEGELDLAYVLIILAVLADGVDGIVARRFGRRWNLGDFLDIMADTASFAFAPAVLMYLTYRDSLGDPDLGLSIISGRLLVLAVGGLLITLGLMRLSRFCLESGSGEAFFTGLPIPSTALLVVVMMVMGAPALLVVAFTFVSASLMISDLKWPKPRGLPGAVTGILGMALVLALLGGERLEVLAELLAYVTFVGSLMYQYLGPLAWRYRDRLDFLHGGGGGDGDGTEGQGTEEGAVEERAEGQGTEEATEGQGAPGGPPQ